MRRLPRRFTQLALTLHIYVSMAGFLLTLLFAGTGLTLNHVDLGLRTRTSRSVMTTVPGELLTAASERRLTDHLRTALGVRSPVTMYKEFPDEIEVVFSAPGSRTHVIVNREDGTASVESESRGWLGRLEDLHKGHDAGRVWAWMIDITAIFLATSALTGIVTLASLPGRRRMGFLIGAVGVVVTIGLYWRWTP